MAKAVKPQLTKAQEHDAAVRFTQAALQSILSSELARAGNPNYVNIERVTIEAVRYGLRTLEKLKDELQREGR